MGEIIIKVPGDVKEVIEIKNVYPGIEEKLRKVIQKFEHYDFVIRNFDKIVGSIEVEETKEEEMYE